MPQRREGRLYHVGRDHHRRQYRSKAERTRMFRELVIVGKTVFQCLEPANFRKRLTTQRQRCTETEATGTACVRNAY
jgi:hypothetical protein